MDGETYTVWGTIKNQGRNHEVCLGNVMIKSAIGLKTKVRNIPKGEV